MDLEKSTIFGIPISNLTFDETVSLIVQQIVRGDHFHHSAINAGKVVSMMGNDYLKKSVISADIISADGQAVVWASRFLGSPLKERVTGIDLMISLIDLAQENKFKIYFFGAQEDVVSKLVSGYSAKFTKDIIAGYRNGYYTKEEEPKIAQEIAESGANLLFVAISSPTKENFLFKYKEVLKDVNFIMGVGGSFDVVAGKVKRAPVWMQNSGLEWLYRVIQEPRRMWKRYLIGNIKFLLLVLKEKLKK